MKIRNCINIAGAATLAFLASPIANAMTNEEKEYLNLYGMIICDRAGAKQLGFSEEEMNAFIDGMKSHLKGDPIPENAKDTVAKMQEYLESRAQKIAEAEAAKTKAANEEFWKKINSDQKIQKTPSGLAYEIITLGEAPLPTENSTVTVNYKGTLPDGTEFDSSEKSGKPAEFSLQQVIPGFREGLQKVGKGGKIRLYIPAELGYGDRSVGIIPPGATLVFDVDMIDVK